MPARPLSLSLVVLLAVAQGATARSPITWSVRGGWLTATDGQRELLGTADGMPVDLVVNDGWLLAGGSPTVTAVGPGGSGRGVWTVTYRAAKGMLRDVWRPYPRLGPNAWLRSLTYTNTSGARQDVTGAFLRVAPRSLPGRMPWRPETFWMGEVGGGRFLAVAYRGEDDMYGRNERPGLVESQVNASWRLEPGQVAEIGSQGVWLADGGEQRFRDEAQLWYRAIGLEVVPNAPPWLPSAVYYKACPSGTIETRSSDVGGFANFAHQLDYLADLGVSAVLYHSVHQHQTPPDPVRGGWNVYGVLDYERIDEISGGAEGFRRLTDETRLRGMHVLSELCLNGYLSPQAAALPEWWTCHRDGQPVRGFGGASMDYSSPQWQEVMADVARRLARDFGVEGLRLDLGSGSGDNWTSPRTNHASFSFLGGSLEMLRAVSQASTVSEWCPVLISEDLVHQPERLPTTPVLYGFQQKQLLSMGLPADLSDGREVSRRLRDFFERERGSLPAGALVVRTLGGLNETVEVGRPAFRFGAGLSRALYGVTVSVPGVVQMTQEDEVGSFEALRRLNWARRTVPELALGDADYTAVAFAPEVFSVLRFTGESSALCLSNLSGKPVPGHAVLPPHAHARGGDVVYDAVSGRRARLRGHTLEWTLAPYETAILRVGRPPTSAAPPRRFQGEAPARPSAPSAFSVATEEGRLVIRSGRVVASLDCAGATPSMTTAGDGVAVRVAWDSADAVPSVAVWNADRWLVSARTALLEDRTLRRHFAFPPEANYRWDRTMVWGRVAQGLLYDNVFPTGRLWQSFVEPLHPDVPALAFADSEGRGIALSGVETTARNIVLTDRSDETFADPFGLELRFYGHDPDLSPRAALLGPDDTWALPSYPVAPVGPQHLSLRIGPYGPSETSVLDAVRLPVGRTRSEIERVGESFVLSEGALFAVKPARVTWAIPTAVTGRFRVRLLLRTSSYAPDGRDMLPAYRVRLDGADASLEWEPTNTASIGTAHFAFALTPALDLDGSPHTIALETGQDWCALRYPLVLAPAGS